MCIVFLAIETVKFRLLEFDRKKFDLEILAS